MIVILKITLLIMLLINMVFLLVYVFGLFREVALVCCCLFDVCDKAHFASLRRLQAWNLILGSAKLGSREVGIWLLGFMV